MDVRCGWPAVEFPASLVRYCGGQGLPSVAFGTGVEWNAIVLGSARKTGGDGGIRTLDRALQPYNGLANRRLQPLGHVSSKADMPDAGACRKRQIWGHRILRWIEPSGGEQYGPVRRDLRASRPSGAQTGAARSPYIESLRPKQLPRIESHRAWHICLDTDLSLARRKRGADSATPIAAISCPVALTRHREIIAIHESIHRTRHCFRCVA
jgi:hypothetical protein